MRNEKELKDQRIPIMMTQSEVQALDDWSFGERIRSRGEAIRKLCQVGLLTTKHLTMVMKQVDILNKNIENYMKLRIEEATGKKIEELSEDDIMHSVLISLKRTPENTIINDILFISEQLSALEATIEDMINSKNVKKSVVNSIGSEIKPYLREYLKDNK